MRRCASGPYETTAPLGPEHYFLNEREIVTDRHGSSIVAYEGDGKATSARHLESLGVPAYPFRPPGKIVDIAGGRVLPELFGRSVAALAGNTRVYVQGLSEGIEVGFQPIAIATGDVDHDSYDEVIALSAGRRYAVCHVDERVCVGHELERGFSGLDLASADIEGDHTDEVVFLVKRFNSTRIVVWNPDFEKHGQDEYSIHEPERDYYRVAAGDLDGDNKSEVIGIANGGTTDWNDFRRPSWSSSGIEYVADRMDILSVAPKFEPPRNSMRLNPTSAEDDRGEATRHANLDSTTGTRLLGSQTTNPDSIDIVAADLNMDGAAEVLVLHEDGRYSAYTSIALGRLSRTSQGTLANSAKATSIAVVDVDGDSPRGSLIDPLGELVAGDMVPVMQVHWPPYSRTYSEAVPYVYVGHTQGTGRHETEVVGMYAATEIGVNTSVPIPFGTLGLDATSRMRSEIRTYHRQSYDQYVGNRLVMTPNIQAHGPDYSVIVVANACYHVYRYRLYDPQGRLGPELGDEMAIAMPVGGQTTSWSSKRYNAMAEALGGDLPLLDGTFEIGNLSSYPTTPKRPDGSPILPSQWVFDQTPNFNASDAARNGWWLSSREYEVREEQRWLDVNLRGIAKLGFVRWNAERGNGAGGATGVSMSQEVVFGGAIPPISDDPSTPEDEYRVHNYTFKPLVYREFYGEEEGGSQSSYYVLTFTIGE